MHSGNFIGLKVKDEEVKPTGTYQFPSSGYYKVYLLGDISSHSSLYQMFNMNYEMISINFTSKFNTSNINSINNMFQSGSNLISIDASVLDTRKVANMNSN